MSTFTSLLVAGITVSHDPGSGTALDPVVWCTVGKRAWVRDVHSFWFFLILIFGADVVERLPCSVGLLLVKFSASLKSFASASW